MSRTKLADETRTWSRAGHERGRFHFAEAEEADGVIYQAPGSFPAKGQPTGGGSD